MSKRRNAGDIVKRRPGSGFTGDSEPSKVRVVHEEEVEWMPCVLGCGDPECREWANLEVVEGQFKGEFLYHISECEMSD